MGITFAGETRARMAATFCRNRGKFTSRTVGRICCRNSLLLPSPVIFHIRFAFRWRADPKFLSNEAVLLIKRTCVYVHLQGIQPHMFRRLFPGNVQQGLPDPMPPITWI